MSTSYLDKAYRHWLSGHYKRIGFDRQRIYTDGDGFVYVSTPCYYCGMPATTEDHTMPLVLLRQLLEVHKDIDKQLFAIVPACHECNLILSSKRFPDLGRRKAFIKQRLRARHKKILAIPTWHEDELQELGRTLQSSVLEGVRRQRQIRERLAW